MISHPAVPEFQVIVSDVTRSGSLASFASMPEHGHWAHHDMDMEGARWNRIHALWGLRSEIPDAKALNACALELFALAHSKGYGDRDSRLFLDPSDVEERDEDYDDMTDRSARFLVERAGADPGWVAALRAGIADSLRRGSDLRLSSEAAPCVYSGTGLSS